MFQQLIHTAGYSYSYSTSTHSNATWYEALVGWVALALLMAFMLFVMWRIYARAGQPGWTVLVPFYNTYVLLKIVNRPGWWLALYFIPIVNFVVNIIVYYDLAKAFGRGRGTLLLMVFIPFVGFPVVSFSQGPYKKPVRG